MSKRITQRDCEILVERINVVTGNPQKTWKEKNGKYIANIGNYHLDYAYGGVMLAKISNNGGGINCPLGSGHIPKRELFEQMQAFLKGISVGKN